MKTVPKARSGTTGKPNPAPRVATAQNLAGRTISEPARTHEVAPRAKGLVLPATLLLLLVGVHLTGLTLLNMESARRVWLEREAQQLQMRNEALRTQLNAISAEPVVQRWAEAQGMVRAEMQGALLLPVGRIASEPSEPSRWQRVATRETR
jgi:hypothetical protein